MKERSKERSKFIEPNGEVSKWNNEGTFLLKLEFFLILKYLLIYFHFVFSSKKVFHFDWIFRSSSWLFLFLFLSSYSFHNSSSSLCEFLCFILFCSLSFCFILHRNISFHSIYIIYLLFWLYSLPSLCVFNFISSNHYIFIITNLKFHHFENPFQHQIYWIYQKWRRKILW